MVALPRSLVAPARLEGVEARLGASQALLPATAIALGLVPAALFALGGGPISLTGMPAPPAPGSVLASRATIACLGPLGQEPAFAAFQQAPAAARMPTARAGAVVDLSQGEGRLTWPTGGTAPEWSGGGKVVLPAATLRRRMEARRRHPSDTHMSAYLQRVTLAREEEVRSEVGPRPRSTNRGMAQLALR